MKLAIRPLTPERWPDLETAFRAKGCAVARGCWCMFYRRSAKTPPPPAGRTKASANRSAFRKVVEAGPPPGLIAYRGKEPVDIAERPVLRLALAPETRSS